MSDNPKDWSKTILPIGSSIREAIQVLNETSLRIVLVTDIDGALVGTISDGDIRRGFVNCLEMTSEIDSSIQREPIVVTSGITRDAVLQLMRKNKIQQIPVVDENRRVIGLHLWDQISAPVTRSNTMVIMAGGKGTRLHPQTENCPKPLLPLSGKPIMEHIIDRAKVSGFSHFVIAIYHLGHMIEDYFGDGEKFGIKIDYLREKSPLGTAGALSLLAPLPKSSIVVTNGDVLTDIHYGDLVDFHNQHKAIGTMAVRVHEWQNPYGVVETRGIEIINYEEKPISRNNINAGVYVIEPDVINLLIKSAHCDMPTLFSLMQKESMQVVAYPIHEPWLDIGHPVDLAEAQKKASSIDDFQGHD